MLSILTDGARATITTKEAGVILPLLAVGDQVLPGDALFSLRPSPNPATTPRCEEGAPWAARRRMPPLLLRCRNWVRRWAWVILALGAYLAAARWVLPQISGWFPVLSAWQWLGVLIALVVIGVGGFHVLARRGGTRGRIFGGSFATAWAILVTGGIYLQAGGVQPLVYDVVSGSRTVATQIATVALQAIPDVPIAAPEAEEDATEETEAEKARRKVITEGEIVYREKSRDPAPTPRNGLVIPRPSE